ncbi:CxxH/CxxC protein [Paenibacillus chartarius]|uniref:CxxH/CxxC protein n=1 Tax=Paenibacillus chartarius TaxID=747481 RepID=A0ABV6DE95_9BACL
MFVVCKEHVEIAIDEFVDEYEDAPDLVDLTEVRFTAWEPPACCQFCSESPRFLIV